MSSIVALGVFCVVFSAVVARQLVGRGPPVWAVFALGAVAAVSLGGLSPASAAAAFAGGLPTLGFLLALFLFADALSVAGALDHLGQWLVGRARAPSDLPAILFVGFGLLSAILVNDAVVLIGVPLLVRVSHRLQADPRPLLLVLATSVTIGSVLTPFGNPQNLLIATSSGLTAPVTTFLRYLAVPTAINLVLGGFYLRWSQRRCFPQGWPDPGVGPGRRAPLWPSGGWLKRLARHPVLLVFPLTMTVIAASDVVGSFYPAAAVPAWLLALGGAGVVVAASPHRGTLVRHVNVSILILFAGLFVVVAAAVDGGVLGALGGSVPRPSSATSSLAIVGGALIGSQLVSNVPWVALQLPLLTGAGFGPATPVAWMALAGASTLAGNLTLLGAASNLILVDAAERRGVTVRLVDFLRVGIPLTVLSFGVLVGCLTVGI